MIRAYINATTKAVTRAVIPGSGLNQNIIYVDGATADYTTEQITGEILTRSNSSWNHPFIYLQNAINVSEPGDYIFVKSGRYKPTHLSTSPTVYNDGDCINTNATFTIKSGVSIYGGFSGTESRESQRIFSAGFATNETILDGDILDEAVIDGEITKGDRRTSLSKANSALNVVNGKGLSSIAIIDGITVKYGNGGSGTGVNGETNKYLHLSRCKVEDCTCYGTSVYGAGVIYCTLTGCNISYCSTIGNNNGAGWSHSTAYTSKAISCYSEYYAGGWYISDCTNCEAIDCYALISGGGWHTSNCTNCIASWCESGNNGGGWYQGVNIGCIANNCIAANQGGGAFGGTNTSCRANYCESGASGAGFRGSTNISCVAFGCIATSSGGGWSSGTQINCVAINCLANEGGGWSGGTQINCVAINCNGTTHGSGWYQGISKNCVAINCVGPNAVRRRTGDITLINVLLFGNETSTGTKVGCDIGNTTFVQIVKNCAWDVANPTGTVGEGSDFDVASCLPSLNIGQVLINIPTFKGYTTDADEIAELELYLNNILTNLKPTAGSSLKNAGINSETYPAYITDYAGVTRTSTPTIGILEGV